MTFITRVKYVWSSVYSRLSEMKCNWRDLVAQSALEDRLCILYKVEIAWRAVESHCFLAAVGANAYMPPVRQRGILIYSMITGTIALALCVTVAYTHVY